MTVLFDGVASGVLLFLISVGLSVTLWLMNFVNLAHGAFAMVGGYVCVVLLNRYGAQARTIIEERLGFWVTAAAVVLVAGIIAALYLL